MEAPRFRAGMPGKASVRDDDDREEVEEKADGSELRGGEGEEEEKTEDAGDHPRLLPRGQCGEAVAHFRDGAAAPDASDERGCHRPAERAEANAGEGLVAGHRNTVE